jgi:hypothetical protein
MGLRDKLVQNGSLATQLLNLVIVAGALFFLVYSLLEVSVGQTTTKLTPIIYVILYSSFGFLSLVPTVTGHYR